MASMTGLIQDCEIEEWRTNEDECDEEDEDDLPTLSHLCLLSLAGNMKVWVQDYEQNYMDQYFFRYVMGPFSLLPRDLLEKLLHLLSRQNLLSRAALHLLLLPQLRRLSFARSWRIVTANVCGLVGARCQSLRFLNLSGAMNVPPSALCTLLSSLSHLNSLVLTGTLSDHTVLSALAHHCPALERLDVSLCARLPPAALLALALADGPRHLTSLRALDIGLGEDGEDEGSVAAFLLLGLPKLQRLALDGAGQACNVIKTQEFGRTETLTMRESVPSLRELWAARVETGGAGNFTLDTKASSLMQVDDSVGTTDSVVAGQQMGKPDDKGDSLRLRLREIQGVSLDSLDAVGQLCPDLQSISLNLCSENEDREEDSRRRRLLAKGLSAWSGRLHRLKLQLPGPLSELVLTLQVSGYGLLSLTLEGIQADGHLPFLELLRSCPKLISLVLHIDPPRSNQEEDDGEEDIVDWNLPRLPQLCSLTLNFTLDERQRRPVLCWSGLKGALYALLRFSPHLHTLSLGAAPCRLDPVFRLVLNGHVIPDEPPLRLLRHASLKRCEVTTETAESLVMACPRLRSLDLSGCWSITLSNIKKLQKKASRRRYKIKITWA